MEQYTPVLIGYMRVGKADGSQALDLQRDARLGAGILSALRPDGENLLGRKTRAARPTDPADQTSQGSERSGNAAL